MLADPVLQESNRRVVVQCGAAAIPVVEHLDVFEEIGLCVNSRRVGLAVHPLALQAVEEALGGKDAPSLSVGLRPGSV